jgi:hypothetical protein
MVKSGWYNKSMDKNLVDLKAKLESVVNILDNYSPDNIPENIKARRIALGSFNRDIEMVKSLIIGKPQAVIDFIDELIDLFKGYFHYFDEGYQSKYSIDVLPKMLSDKISLAIEKINKL